MASSSFFSDLMSTWTTNVKRSEYRASNRRCRHRQFSDGQTLLPAETCKSRRSHLELPEHVCNRLALALIDHDAIGDLPGGTTHPPILCGEGHLA